MNLGFYKNEWQNRWHRFRHRKVTRLDAQEQAYLRTLKDRGWVSLEESPFSPAEVDSLAALLRESVHSPALQSHVWTDEAGADARIFGAEALSPLVQRFLAFPTANRVLDAYLQLPQNRSTTMANVLTSRHGSHGSGGDWHRDTADHHQVKAFIYLTDVGTTNGPLQYVERSHRRRTYAAVAAQTGLPWYERRYTDEVIQAASRALDLSIATLTAPKGTVILADTSGLHRGMPIQEGERVAMTNYIWHQREVPPHIEQQILKP